MFACLCTYGLDVESWEVEVSKGAVWILQTTVLVTANHKSDFSTEYSCIKYIYASDKIGLFEKKRPSLTFKR